MKIYVDGEAWRRCMRAHGFRDRRTLRQWFADLWWNIKAMFRGDRWIP